MPRRTSKSRLPNFDKMPSDVSGSSATKFVSRLTEPLDDMSHEVEPEPFVADPVISRKAARAAVRAADRVSRHSHGLIDSEREDSIPRFTPDELTLGSLLGKGGFSDVYEISAVTVPRREDDVDFLCHGIEMLLSDESDDQQQYQDGGDDDPSLRYRKLIPSTDTKINRRPSKEEKSLYQRMARSFVSEHCIREKTGTARYAIKFLSESCLSDSRQFQTGASDLAVEAKFLANLEHPNIVKLRGVAQSGPEGFASGHKTGYFLLLDRLYGTLEEKLQVWHRQSQKASSNFIKRSVLDRKGEKRQGLLAVRMKVAFDVAGALAFLHSRGVIYRDLKPENIGFDVRGDIKIFDFGLAKELPPQCPNPDNTYKLSGNTGSLRYMAPEVARCQDYNLTADVYSYAILLWQIVSLNKPYDGMDRHVHANEVVYGMTRPYVDPAWSESLRNVLNRGWHPSLHKRPKMDLVYRVVRTEAARLCGGDEALLLDHGRRRSTHVLGRQRIDAVSKPRRAMAA